jgi:hypothetical protein
MFHVRGSERSTSALPRNFKTSVDTQTQPRESVIIGPILQDFTIIYNKLELLGINLIDFLISEAYTVYCHAKKRLKLVLPSY